MVEADRETLVGGTPNFSPARGFVAAVLAIVGAPPLPSKPEPSERDCDVELWPKPPMTNFGAAGWVPDSCRPTEEEETPPPSFSPPDWTPTAAEPNLKGEEETVELPPRPNCKEEEAAAVVVGRRFKLVTVDGAPNFISVRGA